MAGLDALRIADLIRGYRFNFSTEDELQCGLAEAFARAGVAAEREWSPRPGMRDRIDFRVGTVGIEVKIGGSWSEVLRQLHRYAGWPELTDVVLVSAKMQLTQMPPVLNGKPLVAVSLVGSLFG